MQLRRIWIPLAAAGLLSLSIPCPALALPEMTVQVKTGELRATPSYLGEVLGTAGYGTRVAVLEESGAWRRVTVNAVTGWLHYTTLTKEKLQLQGGNTAQAGASSGELALAGKGFNSDVEAEFKKRHANVSFAAVDRIEKLNVLPATLQAFLTNGQVNSGKGGAQ